MVLESNEGVEQADKVEDDDDNMDVEEIDDLLMEVQKELFTRFKNMFESDMLLPNLDFNPEFEEKQPEDQNLLVLEDADEEQDDIDDIPEVAKSIALNLEASNQIQNDWYDENYLRARWWWVPKSHKDKKSDEIGEEFIPVEDDIDEDWNDNEIVPQYYGHYHMVQNSDPYL